MNGIAPPVTSGNLPSHFSIFFVSTSSGVSDSCSLRFASAWAVAYTSVASAMPVASATRAFASVTCS